MHTDSIWDVLPRILARQQELLAQGERRIGRVLATELGCSTGHISHLLLIGRHLGDDVIARAGDPAVIRALPMPRLLDAARKPSPRARALCLRLAAGLGWPDWADEPGDGGVP